MALQLIGGSGVAVLLLGILGVLTARATAELLFALILTAVAVVR